MHPSVKWIFEAIAQRMAPADYREKKAATSPKLNNHITAASSGLLRNLRLYYTAAALPVKQKLIGSMFFPRKTGF